MFAIILHAFHFLLFIVLTTGFATGKFNMDTKKDKKDRFFITLIYFTATIYTIIKLMEIIKDVA